MTERDAALLDELLDGCLKQDRRSQELLYKQFYSFAMSICMRYTNDRGQAKEILNDGFFKIFTKIDSFDTTRSFKSWLSRIMINTALDQYRKESKHELYDDPVGVESAMVEETVIGKLSHDDLIRLIQNLTPAYRSVFNLFVIDGYSHEEIAEKMGITVGASKSNLSRAREKLREMISKLKIEDYDRVPR